MDSPDYVEPLTAFTVGKAVKFPDSSMIQFQCQLRFCDRLLGECDGILVRLRTYAKFYSSFSKLKAGFEKLPVYLKSCPFV